MPKSSQTIYREKKTALLIEIINLSISLALLKKKQLQRVHLAKFKKIKLELQNMKIEATWQ